MISIKPNDEHQLLASISAGNEASFEELYNCYRGRVYGVARMILKSDIEADDIVQEVFAKIWVGRKSLSEIREFKSWIGTNTRNCVYNALRKKANEEFFIKEASTAVELKLDTSYDLLHFRELQYILAEATNKLPPQQRKIFQMGRMDGLKHTEIAQILGISKETVKKHMMEATKRIRKYISATGAFFISLLMTSF